MRPTRLLVVLVVAALCLNPGTILRWKIGQSVAAKMPQLLGPADSYTADVTGGFFGIIRGKIDRLNVHGRGVRLSNGMRVDRLNVVLTGVHFKSDQTVTDVEKTSFDASVTEQNLNDFLRTSRPDVPNAKVVIGPDKLSLSASPRVLGIRTPVSMEGKLQIADSTKLNMILNRIRARGIALPGFLRGRIMHDINPVMDATKMGMPAKLKTVALGKGQITVTGAADITKALAGKRD